MASRCGQGDDLSAPHLTPTGGRPILRSMSNPGPKTPSVSDAEAQPERPADPWLSVVVPVYRRAGEVHLLLRSLPDAGLRPLEVEIILVDDASGDGTAAAMRAAARDLGLGNVRVIEMKQNGGPARARNLGAQEARGRLLFFTDSDCVFEAGSLKNLAAAFARSGVRALSGYCSSTPANFGFFAEYKALMEWSWLPRGNQHTFFPGRHSAIERKLFLEIGGFDTTYRGADIEDYEVGYRIRKATTIHFDPTILVRHHHPGFRKQAILYFRRARMWTRLFMKRGGKFDNTATTASGGVSRALGVIVLLSLGAPVATPWIWPFPVLLLGLYLGLSRRFFGLCLKRKGVLFAARALAAHLTLSCFITAGATLGMAEGGLERTALATKKM